MSEEDEREWGRLNKNEEEKRMYKRVEEKRDEKTRKEAFTARKSSLCISFCRLMLGIDVSF